MITPSIIYVAVTILLAYVDAIRIKVNWDKVKNIDHKISINLALYTGSATLCLWTVLNCKQGEWDWMYFISFAFISLAMVAIRLTLFDLLLNLFRIFMKINPTMRLDYVSTKTSSYEDQHSEKIGFWQKRALAIAAWFILYIVYRLIF